MITINTLVSAIEEAERFIAAAEAARERLNSEHLAGNQQRIVGCKETGSVRRASLDLTRKLAELRSNKWEES